MVPFPGLPLTWNFPEQEQDQPEEEGSCGASELPGLSISSLLLASGLLLLPPPPPLLPKVKMEPTESSSAFFIIQNMATNFEQKLFSQKYKELFSLSTKFFAFLVVVVVIAATPFQMTQIK